MAHFIYNEVYRLDTASKVPPRWDTIAKGTPVEETILNNLIDDLKTIGYGSGIPKAKTGNVVSSEFLKSIISAAKEAYDKVVPVS